MFISAERRVDVYVIETSYISAVKRKIVVRYRPLASVKLNNGLLPIFETVFCYEHYMQRVSELILTIERQRMKSSDDPLRKSTATISENKFPFNKLPKLRFCFIGKITYICVSF